MKKDDQKASRTTADRASSSEPNEETVKAIEAARRGELETAKSVEELFVQLNTE